MTKQKKEAPRPIEASENKAIVSIPENNQLSNFDPATQVEFAQKAAKALMVVIDATKPLVMQGKRYLYFEHWQTIARFFNTTVGTTETIKDANGYIAKAAVYDKNGIIIGGAEASCMKDENNWRNKPDFQLRSMAQTRAMSKALRSIYGFVAVLAGVEATPAEEMADIQETPHQGANFTSNKVAIKPLTSKQADLINKLILQKRLTLNQVFAKLEMPAGELWELSIVDAKKIIDFLITYIPQTSVSTGTDLVTDEARKMVGRLNQAKDPGELIDLQKILGIMREQGKFTPEDIKELTKAYNKANKEINGAEETK